MKTWVQAEQQVTTPTSDHTHNREVDMGIRSLKSCVTISPRQLYLKRWRGHSIKSPYGALNLLKGSLGAWAKDPYIFRTEEVALVAVLSIDQASFIWEEGLSAERCLYKTELRASLRSISRWLTDVGGSSSLWMGTHLGRWSRVIQESSWGSQPREQASKQAPPRPRHQLLPPGSCPSSVFLLWRPSETNNAMEV